VYKLIYKYQPFQGYTLMANRFLHNPGLTVHSWITTFAITSGRQSNVTMARGWPFLGGMLIVTTVTYLNMTTITAIVSDIQSSLVRERRKLDNARHSHAVPDSPETPKADGSVKLSTSTRVADRIRKIWNEDIERSVRRMQNTDWERMGRAVEAHVKRARERMASSFERLGEDSKKKSA
jgi:Altered inheritance of mitochondria 5